MHDDDAASQFEPIRDTRQLQRGRYEADTPGEVTTRAIKRKINAIHCRLLERATRGRLTWNGDEIVRSRLAAISPRPYNPPQVAQAPTYQPHQTPLILNSLTSGQTVLLLGSEP